MNDREKAVILLTQVYGYCSVIRATGIILHDSEKLTMWTNLLKLNNVKLTISDKDEIYTDVYSEVGRMEKAAKWAFKNQIDMFKEFN